MKFVLPVLVLLTVADGLKLNLKEMMPNATSALEVEASLMTAMMSAKSTPEMKAFAEELKGKVLNELQPLLTQSLNKIQNEINSMVGEIYKCFNASTHGADEKTKFEMFMGTHSTCRTGEAALYGQHTTCQAEYTTTESTKRSECDEVDTLKSQQSAIAGTCPTATGETYLQQLERLAAAFAREAETYKTHEAECSNATTKLTTLSKSCTDKKDAYDAKKKTCNDEQATMDSASCSYYEAVSVSCDTCYSTTKKTYLDSSGNFQSSLDSTKQEKLAILRIECYLDAIIGNKEVSACATQDHSAELAKLTLSLPGVPTKNCQLPTDTAGTAAYKAAVYDVLPTDAPAEKCVASCCA